MEKTDEVERKELENICKEVEVVESHSALNNLTSKMRRFVEEYVLDYRPKEAAIRAGYSRQSAHCIAYQLLEHKDIKKYLLDIEKLSIEKNKVSKDYFISKCKDIIEADDAKYSEKISALTLLAKLTGYLKEKTFESKQVVVLQQQGLTQTQNTQPVEYVIEQTKEN